MYKLKECRLAAGKSQMQAAMKLETTQHQISKWERGVQDITLRKACMLADYYHVSLDQLAGRTATERAQDTPNCLI